MKMEKTIPTLESIKVVRASFLSDTARIKHGFSKDDFVEIRVERINPASVNLVKIDGTPGRKFSTLLKESSF